MEHHLGSLMFRIDTMCSCGVCLIVQLGSVLGEALQGDFVSDGLEELFQNLAARFVIVHVLFVTLSFLAVEDTDLVLIVEFLFVKPHQLLIHLTQN